LTVASLKAGVDNNSNLLKIGFSDGSFLVIKDFYLYLYLNPREFPKAGELFPAWEKYSSLEIGLEITAGDEEAIRFAASCYRAERAGKRLIARAEQTQTGLRRKLAAKGFEQSSVSAAIEWFVQTDMVNDERYAERWLESRLARNSGKIRGPRMLLAALGNKGLDKNAMRRAFGRVLNEETEFSLLERFVLKNRIKNSVKNWSFKGFLRSEGFSAAVINRFLEEYSD